MYYEKLIREALARIGHAEVPTAWVEAWLRLRWNTLDGLSRSEFVREVASAVQCIRACSLEENEGLARSYGLVAR